MKKLILLIIFVTAHFIASAQNEDTSIVQDFHGAFIHLHGGSGYHTSDNLKGTLATRIGNNVDPTPFPWENSNIPYSAGAGTMFIFDNGIMLGLNGNFSWIASKKSVDAEVKLRNATIEAIIGKTIYNGNSFFVYPHFGVGFSRYFMSIKNLNTANDIKFNSLKPINVGETQNYTANYPAFDIGLAAKKAFTEKIIVGFDAGYYFTTSTHYLWKNGGKEIEDREVPGSNGFYLRLTFDIAHFGKKHYIDTIPMAYSIDTLHNNRRAGEGPAIESKKKTVKEAEKERKDSTTTPVAEPEKPKKVEKPGKKKSKKVVERKNYNEGLFDFGKPAQKEQKDSLPKATPQINKNDSIKKP